MTLRGELELFSKSLLEALRQVADASGYDKSEIPRWLNSTGIRIGELNGSGIIFLEGIGSDEDEVIEYREVSSDVEFVFPQREADCGVSILTLSSNDRGVTGSSSIQYEIDELDKCFTDIHLLDDHLSLVLTDVMLGYRPDNVLNDLRYVPFAIFLTKRYILDFDLFWSECSKNFVRMASGSFGFKHEQIQSKGVISSVEDTVIVLGSYDSPYESELRNIRDYLKRLGYDAFLIKELPDLPQLSLEEKVRAWVTSSRYCIIVDREASGHIKEYEIVKQERKPLIFLQPTDGGSTYMIGDDYLVDLNYLNKFEFDQNPMEEIENGVRWAEDLLNERGREYPEFYPWVDD